MASSLWSYWKTIETISPRSIEDEALKEFKIALIGTAEHRAVLKAALLTDRASEWEKDDSANYLREYDASPDADTAGAFLFRIYTAGPDEPLGVRGPNSVPISGTFDEIIVKMLDTRPDYAIALARRLPAFRIPACKRIIRDVSRVNATIALVSALPRILPITGIILPASSVADVILLTKNQVVLVMRLAAAFGKKPAYSKQIKELLAIAGSALGWRALARELVGLVPAGIGVALKASIAYSGTAAIGEAAFWLYQTGQQPTKEQVKKAYEDSEAEAKSEVATLLKDALPGKKDDTITPDEAKQGDA